jgi:hypothetical protein
MALHATHPYARPLRGSTGRSGPTLPIVGGSRGKPDLLTIRATRLADLCDELTARKSEAVALVTGLLPLVAFVTSAAREVSPAHLQAALMIAVRLRRYQSQNEDPEPDDVAVAA